MFTKEEIGAILKRLRLASGKTQKDVAETLGRKQQVIGHWETGYSQPDADTLFVLCELYGTTVNDAFGFNDEKHEVNKTEYEHIKKYRRLNDNSRRAVDITIDTMLIAQEKEETVRVFQAAHTDDRSIPAGYVDMPKEEFDRIVEAPVAKNKNL